MSLTGIQPWLLIGCLIPLIVTIIRTRTVPGARFQWWTLYLAMVAAVLNVVVSAFDELAKGNPWALIPAAAVVVLMASAVALLRNGTRPLPDDPAAAEAARAARSRNYRIHSWVIGLAAAVALVSVFIVFFIVPVAQALSGGR